MRCPLTRLPFAILLLAATALPQSGKDDLSRAFARWLRDFAAGKIEPDDVRGATKKPYLTRKLIARLPPQLGRYNRLREARDLFTLLAERGTAADGKRLIRVVAVSLKKKGGKFWEVTGRFTRFRNVCLRILTGGRCPEAIQAALVDRVRAGLVQTAGAAGDPESGPAPPAALSHKEPELATALLPVLGRFRQRSFRKLFEDCLRVQHSGVQTAAARAITALGFGPSITAVARALNNARYSDDVAVLADSISRLVEAREPPPAERDLKFALNVVLDRFAALDDWRSRIALIRIMQRIRSRGTVPVLVAFLEDANDKLAKTGKAGRRYSGTLMSAAHETLVDLSGFYAGVREPARWRAWWESVKEDFVLAPGRPRRSAQRGATVAHGFFGIPVSGNRVVFVVDVSGSMQWPYETATSAGKSADGGSGYESRLARAKTELLEALDGMTPDSKFNVVFFSNSASAWKKKLVWANRRNKQAIRSYLEHVTAGGGTALYDGMDEAMKIKLQRRREDRYATSVDEIFLLSDGSPTLGSVRNTDKILDLVRTWNQGAQVRVNTVFIGDEDVDRAYAPPNTVQRLPGNMAPADFMRKLARQNHGKFVEPNKR